MRTFSPPESVSEFLAKLTAYDDVAIAPIDRDTVIIGIGPFDSSATPLSSGVGEATAFYQNDFTLSSAEPWKFPRHTLTAKRAALYPLSSEFALSHSSPRTEWLEPAPEPFAKIFREITNAIHQGVIEKSVPVNIATAELNGLHPRQLLLRALTAPPPLMPYAYWQGEYGFAGASPELLFTQAKDTLDTMALAGTARATDADIFAFDDKEIREHEFVAQTIVAKLADIGSVHRTQREVMDLGPIVHFLSRIQVKLHQTTNLNRLVKKLHPTPALGPLPRTDGTLQQLHQWRSKLNCPPSFGAPFGVSHQGRFTCLVAIRNIHWHGQQLLLPAGCGIIEASRLVNEWRELRLKRDSVRQLFKLP